MPGRVVVVTGGSRGLGAAISRHFAERGDTVVVASRKAAACTEVAAALTSATGSRVDGLACHVGSWTDCDALIDTVSERFGRLDVLVNNAGMSPLYPSLAEVSEELFDKVLAVNLRGPFRLSVRAAELMASGGGGSIVNISSTAAVRPSGLDLPYAAAKAALNTITVGLAGALGPHVRVNAIMAGPFDTDVTKAWSEETRMRTAHDRIPLGRMGAPIEIVGAVDHLTGTGSSYTTGAILTVDGGMSSRSS